MLVDTPVRIGVQLQPQQVAYADLRDAVRRLEDAGVDILFNWDHFFPLYGDPDGPHFESWTMLAAWAEQTSRVQFGALVNCNSYRNPDLQADMARTIDHISGGRFIFGTGSGWFQRDYDEYGYDFGTAGSRLDDLAEGLARVVARWGRLNPPPAHRIPVLIGGGGERKTLRLVARYADIWHTFAHDEDLVRKIGVIQAWGERDGHDTSGILISGDISRRTDDEVDRMHADGVRLFTLALGGPQFDYERVHRMLAWRDARNGGAA